MAKGTKIRLFYEPSETEEEKSLSRLEYIGVDKKKIQIIKDELTQNGSKIMLGYQILDEKNEVIYQLSGPDTIFLTPYQAK